MILINDQFLNILLSGQKLEFFCLLSELEIDNICRMKEQPCLICLRHEFSGTDVTCKVLHLSRFIPAKEVVRRKLCPVKMLVELERKCVSTTTVHGTYSTSDTSFFKTYCFQKEKPNDLFKQLELLREEREKNEKKS